MCVRERERVGERTGGGERERRRGRGGASEEASGLVRSSGARIGNHLICITQFSVPDSALTAPQCVRLRFLTLISLQRKSHGEREGRDGGRERGRKKESKRERERERDKKRRQI